MGEKSLRLLPFLGTTRLLQVASDLSSKLQSIFSTIQQVLVMASTELLPGSNSKDSVGVVTIKKVLW
ncbi:hypothetical protein IAS59_000013 [Cryptococcus gattii]